MLRQFLIILLYLARTPKEMRLLAYHYLSGNLNITFLPLPQQFLYSLANFSWIGGTDGLKRCWFLAKSVDVNSWRQFLTIAPKNDEKEGSSASSYLVAVVPSTWKS